MLLVVRTAWGLRFFVMNRAALFGGSVAFVFLVTMLVALILPACGARPPFLGFLAPFCSEPVAADPRLAAADADRRALEDEIAGLERELAQLRCTQPVAELPQRSEEDETMEDVIREGDEQALAGCWDLISDYSIRDQSTGASYPVESWQVCFDEQGQGEQRLRYENGVQCNGPVRADISSGTLRISDIGDLPCSNGFRIFERVTDCQLTGSGRVRCMQTQERTSSRTSVEIRRSRESVR